MEAHASAFEAYSFATDLRFMQGLPTIHTYATDKQQLSSQVLLKAKGFYFRKFVLPSFILENYVQYRGNQIPSHLLSVVSEVLPAASAEMAPAASDPTPSASYIPVPLTDGHVLGLAELVGSELCDESYAQVDQAALVGNSMTTSCFCIPRGLTPPATRCSPSLAAHSDQLLSNTPAMAAPPPITGDAPHSPAQRLSMAQVMEYIQAGLPVPGCVKVSVAMATEPPTCAVLARPLKPWERGEN